MENDIINNAVIKLSELVGNANVRLKKSSDSEVDIVLFIKDVEFLCKIKNTVTTSNFGNVHRSLKELHNRTDKPILLIAQNIYPQLMNELIQNGINSLDAAGNCQIKVDELYIHVEGKKQTVKPVTTVSNKSRLFQEAGLKIIFRLLENEEWINLSYRQMQLSANVSLGSVNIIMNELIEAGYILKTENGKFVKNRKELLERWIIGYNDILKPKLFLKRMTFKNKETKQSWAELSLPSGSCWGGEAAANLYDGYLYPEQYTLYGENIGSLVKAGLRPDEEGEISVYSKFWTFEGEEKTTPLLLTYADLMGSGISRNIEAAQRIYTNELQYLR